jgi:DNA-directed RNA polymerase specialized sigma24 family protein
MLGDAQYEAALNYFYFLTMDESAAVNLSLKTVRQVQRKIKSDPTPKVNQLLIKVMAHQLRKMHSRHFLMGSTLPKSDWKISNSEIYSQWKQFLRHSDIDSSETLVLRYILKFPVDVIAQGLEIHEGTIYFRLGKGLESFSKGPK